MRPETERALRANDSGFSTDLSTAFVDKSVLLILQIALDTPLRRAFDYLPPSDAGGFATPRLEPGLRVRVPFGRRHMVGILVGTSTNSAVAQPKLKPALEI